MPQENTLGTSEPVLSSGSLRKEEHHFYSVLVVIITVFYLFYYRFYKFKLVQAPTVFDNKSL